MKQSTESPTTLQAELPAVVLAVAVSKAQKVLADWSGRNPMVTNFETLCTLAEILDDETLAAAQRAVSEA